MMTSPPSSAVPTAATSRAASALPVAHLVGAAQSARTTAGTRRVVSSAEVMPSRYRGAPLVTIGLPSSRRREIPTPGPAGRPTEGRLCALPTARTGAGTVDPMIEINAVTKRYGSTTAVSGLTFTVRPGVVTGFLGPNGAGKTTTMRMILGLDEPTSGAVTVNGRAPRAHAAPLREVGGMLDPRAVHPARSAFHHLLSLAQTAGLGRSRVLEVIEAAGLGGVARRPAGGFSLGMAQRLGIAAALLGDPASVVLDEPVNGLDVEGIRWIRGLLAGLAARGKAVLVSSHLMSEIAQTATHLIVIGRGRLIADTSVGEFLATAAPPPVRVRSSDQHALAGLLRSPGVTVTPADGGALAVFGLPAGQVGAAAAAAGITVLELATEQASLEEAFVNLTQDAVEFRATPRPPAGPGLEETK